MVKDLSLENFTTGQIASLNFSHTGLSYSHTASTAAPFTPIFDTELPPLALDADIYQDDTVICINELGLSIEQPIAFLKGTCDINGNFAGRASDKRTVTGSFAPYSDDASVQNFTDFDTTAPFALFARMYNPSGVAGEFADGSIVGIYMPNVVLTTAKFDNLDGVLRDALEFRATG